MIDVEEGELVEPDSQIVLGRSSAGDINEANEESHSMNCMRRASANKKKNKRKRKSSGTNLIGINRFVLDTCRHLKEKKWHRVYTAVGGLGVSAISDLIKRGIRILEPCYALTVGLISRFLLFIVAYKAIIVNHRT